MGKSIGGAAKAQGTSKPADQHFATVNAPDPYADRPFGCEYDTLAIQCRGYSTFHAKFQGQWESKFFTETDVAQSQQE